MPLSQEPVLVAVYVDKESDRELAQRTLAAVNPGAVRVYDGLVEGLATPAALRTLYRANLMLDFQEKPSLATGDTPQGPIRRTKRTDPELERQFQIFAASGSPAVAEAVPAAAPPGLGMAPAVLAAAPPAPAVYRVRLSGPMCEEWRKQLAALGVKITSYRRGTYQMRLDAGHLAAVRALPYVEEVKPYDLLDTVTSDLLLAMEVQEQEAAAGDSGLLSMAAAERPPDQVFDVVAHAEADVPAIKAAIAAAPEARLLDAAGRKVRFAAPMDSPFLVDLGRRVEALSPFNPPTLYCDFGRSLIGIQTINEVAPGPPGDEHWTGKGEIVGILDSGIDATHPDLADRIQETVSFQGCPVDDGFGHGTHVAGIIAGTGASSAGKIRGVAPGAKLVVVSMVDEERKLRLPLDLGTLLSEATGRGAKIVNISWGTPLGGSYDTGSDSIDRFLREHPDVLVVVAAGNSGVAPTGQYTFSTVGTPASAKNVLTVGACCTDRNGIDKTWGQFRPAAFSKAPASDERVAGDPQLTAAISSRGPTDYDSVKPDLLAPGTFIASTRAARIDPLLPWQEHENAKYVYIGGTSMAAPIVTGAAAVLRQFLREKTSAASPSAALLKALLLSSVRRLPTHRSEAQDKVVGYPDFDQGFGRVDLATILPHGHAPAKRRILFVDVANDADEALESRMPPGAPRKSARTYKATVADGATDPLIVTLTWTDAPGNDIQNNLQLDVRGPNGFGSVGNPDHRFRRDSLFDDLGLGGVPYDKRNNVEQVRLENPPAGDYFFRVIAQNTVTPPQGYALCVCGELDSEALETGL